MAINSAFKPLTLQEKMDIKRKSGKAPCAECKRLKLKCDRSIPCASCVRRGCGGTCPTGTYLPTGRGKRAAPTEASRLRHTLSEMEARMVELETAITTACGYHLDYCPHLGISIKEPTTAIDHVTLGLGALGVSDTGPVQYFGRTAGTEALLSFEDNDPPGGRARATLTFATVTDLFSFDLGGRMSWDPQRALVQLSLRLPARSRAWELCEVYFQNGCWSGTPIMREELVELLSQVYGSFDSPQFSSRPLQPPCSVHQMAVLYGVFALGSLVDLTLPPYNLESEFYFDVARAALSIVSVFDHPTIATVQSLVLISVFLSHGGPRFSMEGAWSTICLASHICQKMGLHTGRSRPQLSEKQIWRQRALFWETYYIETLQGLAVGRPTSMCLANINCPFPTNDEQQIDDADRIRNSYYRGRWEFVKQVAAPVVEAYLTAQSPSYDVIVDLDQRIRKFMHSSLCTKPSVGAEQGSPSSYIQSRMVYHSCITMILYIHNNHFVSAMRENPEDPYYTSHATSFLSAYRYASELIRADIENFARHPELFLRWWSVWKSLFNAAIIVGAVAAKCPQTVYAPQALLELFVAVDLFERGAATSFRAYRALNILRTLRNKAIAAYAKHTRDPAAELPIETVCTEAALDILAGHTRVVVQTILARDRCAQHAPKVSPTLPDTTPSPSVLPDTLPTATLARTGTLDPSLVEYFSAPRPEFGRVSNPKRVVNQVENGFGDEQNQFQHEGDSAMPFAIPPFFMEQQAAPQWNDFLQNL
ncbi:hypothetical protein B0H11DRAFT_1989462 [Mycena galericulata]|nr:hypothetical protein B0H11DRAFT_1989462 [Mycena galericulata]